MKKKIPEFKDEKTERDFWLKNDSTDYLNWKDAKKITFSKLKPSTKNISLRLPASMIDDLKLLANKRDVPYQSLLKILLAESLEKEMSARG